MFLLQRYQGISFFVVLQTDRMCQIRGQIGSVSSLEYIVPETLLPVKCSIVLVR